MKRGEPPARKTPLRARKPWRSRPKATGPTQEVVEAVYERASWSCERCSAAVGPVRGLDHHIHHRRPRGDGGTRRPETNWPSNLLLLCPACHTEGKTAVESRRKSALAAGWLVHQDDDPAAEPVVIHGPRLVWLTPDGRYSDRPPGRD